ncbi:hypothetical protein E3_1960 [Rhodococcus phage E3]|uniref:hypothetical protein n=1 Tax=Rhodococcus phage E3 TaxID=1007869 RepID=UPI0002C6AC11|nr:hypothetical protein M176_gp208 [Rhodococcus phage E3]AEQ21116.1 hypothetical protein E3_1960 [Rhodococcus phage E3]
MTAALIEKARAATAQHPEVATEEELDSLPPGSLVRVHHSRGSELGKVFERSGWRSCWTELDPSDRYDGENSADSGDILALLRFSSHDKVTVIYVPEEN